MEPATVLMIKQVILVALIVLAFTAAYTALVIGAALLYIFPSRKELDESE